ncbi:hypothetical protein [Campylobacter gastrosuis]|uniref:Uncharacterized protein n=1 Tax=Campylobacter gastrosuis TaxID=2974576 RepID=A0ABT7HSQ4_9BACT|nr:hypothetical protein [Campylobacter gastrosuis]MDL0089954.1 hypothetical protein [Campylobacter gastrosuis]
MGGVFAKIRAVLAGIELVVNLFFWLFIVMLAICFGLGVVFVVFYVFFSVINGFVSG